MNIMYRLDLRFMICFVPKTYCVNPNRMSQIENKLKHNANNLCKIKNIFLNQMYAQISSFSLSSKIYCYFAFVLMLLFY